MDFTGRIDRRRYIIAQLVFLPLTDVGLGALALALWNIDHDFPADLIPQLVRGAEVSQPTAWAILAVAAIASIVGLIGNLSFTVRRLHDLGFSGWFIFLPPIVMLVDAGFSNDIARAHAYAVASGAAFATVLMMVPGVAEANIYGVSVGPKVGGGP